jgi:hypothetical protein
LKYLRIVIIAGLIAIPVLTDLEVDAQKKKNGHKKSCNKGGIGGGTGDGPGEGNG